MGSSDFWHHIWFGWVSRTIPWLVRPILGYYISVVQGQYQISLGQPVCLFTAVPTPTTWYIIAHSGFPKNPQGRHHIPCRIELTCVSDRLFANSVLQAPFTGPRYSFTSLLNGSRREGFAPSDKLTFKAHEFHQSID